MNALAYAVPSNETHYHPLGSCRRAHCRACRVDDAREERDLNSDGALDGARGTAGQLHRHIDVEAAVQLSRLCCRAS